MTNLTLFLKLVVATSSLPLSLLPSLPPSRFGSVWFYFDPVVASPVSSNHHDRKQPLPFVARCGVSLFPRAVRCAVRGWVPSLAVLCETVKSYQGKCRYYFLGGGAENLLLLTRWVITRAMGKSGRGMALSCCRNLSPQVPVQRQYSIMRLAFRSFVVDLRVRYANECLSSCPFCFLACMCTFCFLFVCLWRSLCWLSSS